LVSHLKEAKSLRAFKNKMLRKIFGPKWKELTGDWIQQRNEDSQFVLLITCYLARRMGGAGHMDCIRKKRNIYRFLIGKQTGK
jgi:hypothetical protein